MNELSKIRVRTQDLQIGMFVCELDRPWIETPFPLAGFPIKSYEEIDALRRYCRYVYLDIELGDAPATNNWSGGRDSLPLIDVQNQRDSGRKSGDRGNTGSKPRKRRFEAQHRIDASEYSRLRKHDYEPTVDMLGELQSARKVSDRLHNETMRVLAQLQSAKKPNLEALQENISDTVESLIRNSSAMLFLLQLEKSDEYSYTHAIGSSVWCAELGRYMGLDRANIESLALGGLLLDIGKTRLPRELFGKDEFTEEDHKVIRSHVALSLDIIAEQGGINDKIVQMVATHHERYDGSGYPNGLLGNEVPLFGRIAGLVDSFDAMTTRRPFTDKVLSPHRAVSELYAWQDKLFDAELVGHFIKAVGIYPAGSLVELTSGQVGVVMSINNSKKLRPAVLLLLDENKNTYDQPRYVDLARSDQGLGVKRGISAGAYGVRFDEIDVAGISAF